MLEMAAPKMLPVVADAVLISPKGDETVDGAPKMELVLAGTVVELEATPNTGVAPKLLAVGATETVLLLLAPKAGGLLELVAPNTGTC